MALGHLALTPFAQKLLIPFLLKFFNQKSMILSNKIPQNVGITGKTFKQNGHNFKQKGYYIKQKGNYIEQKGFKQDGYHPICDKHT